MTRRRASLAALVGLVLGSLFAVPSAHAFPGSNGKIAFTSVRGQSRDVYVMNADGSGQVNLTNAGASDYDPAWSPDGTRIAFVSDRDGDNDIYVMSADGSGVTNLTNDPAVFDLAPSWSPDGTRITFQSDRGGDDEIFVMNADGTGQVRLTNEPGRSTQPAWSPDGTRIAFTSSRDGNNEIYVMNADGSGQVRLTDSPATDWTPAWSPDGTRLSFTTFRDGEAEVYVMNADGTEQVNLSNDLLSYDADGTWSPDAALIAFVSNRAGGTEIFVMNADGTDPVNLTNATGFDSEPDWQPIVDTVVDAPTVTGADPASPANDNTVMITGTAAPGTTVNLYATADCSGDPVAAGTADAFGSPGLEVSVPDDSTTELRATATDGGRSSSCSTSFVTYVEDSTPPAIAVPTEVSADATSPTGAVVAYGATASDAVSGDVPVTCSPASGERFPIGTTQIECLATDQAGNTSSATIPVTVRGARDQVTDLIARVRGSSLSSGPKSALVGTLQIAGYWLEVGKTSHATLALEVFVFEVRAFRSAGLLDPGVAQDWIDAARRIQAVVGAPLFRKVPRPHPPK